MSSPFPYDAKNTQSFTFEQDSGKYDNKYDNNQNKYENNLNRNDSQENQNQKSSEKNNEKDKKSIYDSITQSEILKQLNRKNKPKIIGLGLELSRTSSLAKEGKNQEKLLQIA